MRRAAPLSLLIVLALAACSGGEGDPAAAGGGPPGGGMPPLPVEAVTVKAEPFAAGVSTVGTLRADEAVVVRPEIAGRLVKVGFEEGQRVEAGAILFELDDSVLRASLNESLANFAAAKVANGRAEKLGQDKLISVSDRDLTRVTVGVTQARASSAQAQLAKTTLRAPFGGIVGLREVSVGEVVNPGQALVNLVRLDPMEVEFSLPENQLSKVAAGHTVSVTLDAFPDEVFTGTVHAIEPQVDVASRSTRLRAKIGNGDYRLRPGLFARVSLGVGAGAATTTALMIPEQALLQDGESRYVYTIVDGKAHKVAIKTGARLPGKLQVTEGLKDGDVVITAGQTKPMMGEGLPVQPVPDAPADEKPAETAAAAPGKAQ